MFKKKDSTRLGEILVSKGLITPEQLTIATHEQAKRNRLLSTNDATPTRGVMIGEILVEFGFINQLELNRGLNWQQRLRHVSIAMALCAPFMVFAPVGASAQTTSPSSSSSSISASKKSFSPITIQAESYSAMNGVASLVTTDAGSEKYVGNIDANDWMSYTNSSVYIPTAGNYKITYRIASLRGGGSLVLKEANTEATLDSFAVPKTDGWHTWGSVERTVYLSQGTHSFKLLAATGGFNINWFKIEMGPTPMPLTIRAENYSDMGGIFTQPTSDQGGGNNVGNIDAKDWLTYNNIDVIIPATATYKITYRVASRNGGGKFTLNESSDQAVIDTVTVPKTNGWQDWVDVERTVTLTAGQHNFRINVVTGGFNFNWFKIEPVASTSSNSQNVVTSNSSSSTNSSLAASSKSSSSPPSVSNSSSSAAAAAAPATPFVINKVKGSVGLSWLAPNQRENGSFLDITEMGGFELRYKLASAANFTYITINDAWTTQHNFTWLEGDYIFQIAAFDKNGVYSNFVDIRPK